MSLHLTPFSRYRSFGDASHRNDGVLRSVETVGRFRRTYSFDPAAGTSATKVASDEYRSKTDWRAPIEDDVKELTYADAIDPRIQSIRGYNESQNSKETDLKDDPLSKELDGLKSEVEEYRQQIADAHDPREYLTQVNGLDGWRVNEIVNKGSRNQSRADDGKYGRQMYKITIRVKEIVEGADKILQEREVTKRVDIQKGKSDSLDIFPVSQQKQQNDKRQTPPALTAMHNDIGDVLQWIADREAAIEKHEMGQNYQDVQEMQKRFNQFIDDTEFTGGEKIRTANKACDQVIALEHADAPLVALWKDNLNEAWENLQESMRTWSLLLEANEKLHRFLNDCHEVHRDTQDKIRIIPDELSQNSGNLFELQRKHQTLASDVENLERRVQQLQSDGDALISSYAGDKAAEIRHRLADVMDSWHQLHTMFDHNDFNETSAADLFHFMQMVKDALHWIEAVKGRIIMIAKPKGAISAESVQRDLRAIRSDTKLHEDAYESCISYGRQLLSQRHYGSYEVEKKINQLECEKEEVMKLLGEKWEQLELALDLCDYVTVAPSAGSFWLLQHGPAEQMIAAITKREGRNSSAIQEEVFHSLINLPLADLKELHKTQIDEARKTQSLSNVRQPTPQRIETTFFTEDGTTRVETTLGGETANGISGGDICEGVLVRKHTWISVTRKARRRKWLKFYCILRDRQLQFYKDRYTNNGINADSITISSNSLVERAWNYTKRDHVFSIRLEDGAEFLFQAHDAADMDRWLHHLLVTTGQHQASDWRNRSPLTLSEPILTKAKHFL